jgi:tRNA (guanosine-2'-O-)-methyltransferase
MQADLINHLSTFVTAERKKRFEEVLKNRTQYIAVALEDIYQPHNASAVLRSCDGFGIQDVYIIENKNKYLLNPDVTLGSDKWLTLLKYNKEENNTLKCIHDLKSKGYTIAVTNPHSNSHTSENLPLNNKVALFFGTEQKGCSEELKNSAGMFVNIPMLGFSESFNISVAAALCLYVLSSRIRNENIDWKLSATEKEEVLLNWYRNSIPEARFIEKEYMKHTANTPTTQ